MATGVTKWREHPDLGSFLWGILSMSSTSHDMQDIPTKAEIITKYGEKRISCKTMLKNILHFPRALEHQPGRKQEWEKESYFLLKHNNIQVI